MYSLNSLNFKISKSISIGSIHFLLTQIIVYHYLQVKFVFIRRVGDHIWSLQMSMNSHLFDML